MRPSRLFNVLSFLMSSVFLIVLVSFSNVWAATITVTNTLDDGSAGSLRYAITNASLGDTIVFSLPNPSTITLDTANGPLSINKDLTITGPGAQSLTISGGNAVQVFNISSGTVNIAGLTISNGHADVGGGIWNANILTLTNVTLSGNSASSDGGGIWDSGTLTLTNVTLSGNSASGNGGGIFGAHNNYLVLTNVTLSGNSANQGGGIFNYNLATLTNVTLSGNSANQGGGIFNGAGITLINVTLSGNSADQGGGIFNTGAIVALRNTIVANNTAGGNCVGVEPLHSSLGHNLEDANTCGFTGTGDLINTNPQLGPLALNAPGTTETMALSSTSPAIDEADPVTFPSTDQRGVARPQGAGPDIGAYEYIPPPPVPAMNEWGMIIFILLAGLGSVSYLKRRRRAEG